MFFLIPVNVVSERPIALMPTLIRWWEASRAPDVAKWQQKYRVEWDAADGRSGGAQQTVWEIVMEMKRFDGNAKEEDQGTVALVQNQAKAFECLAAISSTRGGHILPPWMKANFAAATAFSVSSRGTAELSQ